MATLPALPDIAPPAPRSDVGADRPMLEKPEKISKNAQKVPVSKPPLLNDVKNDMSAMQFLRDAREALVGIPADFLAKRATVYDIITKQNRLRGIGVILIAIALVLAISNILGPGQC